MTLRSDLESRFERGLFFSRWLMAPMYLGLSLTLVMLLVVFAREMAYYMPASLTMTSDEAILAALTLIDLTLAANLVLIVLFSGYENFVSKLDIADSEDRPAWMGTVDFSGLKLKLVASIVAISGIHLLKRFMEIGKMETEAPFDPLELRWMVVIYLTFVISGVLLALMDWLSSRSSKY